MEENEKAPRRPLVSPTKPLHLRKKSSPQIERPKQYTHNLRERNPSTSRFAPQTSSTPKDMDSVYVCESSQTTTVCGKSPHSALSDCVHTYFSDSPTGNAPYATASHSTISNVKGNYHFDSPSAILGDFVQVNKTKMDIPTDAMGGLGLSES
jgi:hypothetical protein